MGLSSSSATFPGEAALILFWDRPRLCSDESGSTPPSPEQRHKEHREDRKTGGRRVLLIGKFRELALYRAEVLRMHGFRVSTPATVAAAMEAIRRREFDIVVLSYTLASDVVEELAEQVRQYCPSCPLIAISDTRSIDRKIFPDATAFAQDGPAALIAALHRVSRDVN
ncbi:MAG TPA: response regulator [Terriglobales bacterium]|nr:response regulator [Terriglobales bacterium]